MDVKKRKLKSRNSSEKTVQIEELPCVQGGWLKEPRVLDILDMGPNGRFIRVTAKATWLHEILAGEKHSAQWRERLTTCLGELRDNLTEQTKTTDGLATESVAQSIREKLTASGLSEDDSEDDFAGICRDTSSPRPSAKDRSRPCSAKLVVHTVQLKDHDVLAALYRKTMLLQYSPENLQTFVSLAKSYTTTDVDEKKHETAERREIASGDTRLHW